MVHDSKWWYVIPIAPRSKVMYNTFTDMEHMEDVASRKEDDVEHANVDDHDNEDECAISHDHEDDPTIEDDGDVMRMIKASIPLSMGKIAIVE